MNCKHRYEPFGVGEDIQRWAANKYCWLCKRCGNVILAELKEQTK